MAAAHNIFIVSSSNVFKIMSVRVRGGLVMGAFEPYFATLSDKSFVEPVKPFCVR